MGTTNATLEFENIRIDREFSSIGNRLQNLDSANYAKTADAAIRQIEDIKLIDEIFGIENIQNKKQKELMKLRLHHEDYSLIELANELSKITGNQVSKSNISHLFRAIHQMAELYKGSK